MRAPVALTHQVGFDPVDLAISTICRLRGNTRGSIIEESLVVQAELGAAERVPVVRQVSIVRSEHIEDLDALLLHPAGADWIAGAESKSVVDSIIASFGAVDLPIAAAWS
jgi:hypothetical protein